MNVLHRYDVLTNRFLAVSVGEIYGACKYRRRSRQSLAGYTAAYKSFIAGDPLGDGCAALRVSAELPNQRQAANLHNEFDP